MIEVGDLVDYGSIVAEVLVIKGHRVLIKTEKSIYKVDKTDLVKINK